MELVIVLAVIAVLVTLALPAYQDFIERTKLRSATTGLSAFRGVLEQSYQDNRSYRTDDNSACRIATYTTDYFALTCTTTSDTTYTLTATSNASEGLGAAGDYVYTIDQDGNAKTTKFNGTATSYTEWIYR